jgi:hypothetical protein
MGDVGSVQSGSFAVDLEGAVGPHLGTSSRVNAVVDLFGPTNMLHAHDFPTFDHDAASSPESRLIGGALQQFPERWATVDPLSFLTPDDAPMLALHGTDDTTVPFHQSELLLDAARAIGHAIRLLPIQDNGHGGAGFSTPAVNAVVDAFLDRSLRDLPTVLVRVDAIDDRANESGDPARFRVTRSGASAAPLAVRLWLGGEVTPTVDCAAFPLLCVIPAGGTSIELALAPLDDALVEGDEQAVLHLGASDAYRIDAAASSARALLVDDETATGLPSVSLEPLDPTAAEAGLDPGAIRVVRSGSTASSLDVRYEVAGTATPDVDFLALSGIVTIPTGASAATLVVRPRQDGTVEAGETVIFGLAAGALYARGASRTAHVVLADDDRANPRPIVGVLGTELALAEPSDGGAFTLTRTGGTLQPLTVRYAISGRATSGADFGSLAGSAVIPSGAAWVRVPLVVLDDALLEGDEDVVLTLLPDATYSIGVAAQRALTIGDDEATSYEPAALRFAVSPLALREPALFSVVGGAPGGFASIQIALAPAHLPLVPFGVLQIDLSAGFAFAVAPLDASGALHFGFVIPDRAELLGAELWFQALGSIEEAPFAELGVAAMRRVLGPRAR